MWVRLFPLVFFLIEHWYLLVYAHAGGYVGLRLGWFRFLKIEGALWRLIPFAILWSM